MNEWHQAEFHAQKAHKHYEGGAWEDALAELKLALTLDPSQSDWHFGMGLTLEALRRYGEAIASFEEVLRLRGEDIDAMLHLGTDLIRAEQVRRGIRVLARVAELDPACEPSYCQRIHAHARLGEHEQAEEMFYMARQYVDECPTCFDHVAASLEARGEIDRAIWCWRQALRLDPHYPQAFGNLARAHWRRGQLERARELFLDQLREDPADAETLVQLGAVLAEGGRRAEAAEKFHKALELDPTCAAAHLHLGELAFLADRLDAAVAELEMADRLDPQSVGVHLCLAQIASRRRDLDRLRFHLRSELDRYGHSPAQTLELARLLIEARIVQPAIELLTPLVETGASGGRGRLSDHANGGAGGALGGTSGGGLASAYLYRGVARLLLGQHEDGIRDLYRTLRHAPDHALAMQNLALGYLQGGRLKRARYWLRRALALEPTSPQLRQLSHKLMQARVSSAFLNVRRRVLATLGPTRPQTPAPRRAA